MVILYIVVFSGGAFYFYLKKNASEPKRPAGKISRKINYVCCVNEDVLTMMFVSILSTFESIPAKANTTSTTRTMKPPTLPDVFHISQHLYIIIRRIKVSNIIAISPPYTPGFGSVYLVSFTKILLDFFLGHLEQCVFSCNNSSVFWLRTRFSTAYTVLAYSSNL